MTVREIYYSTHEPMDFYKSFGEYYLTGQLIHFGKISSGGSFNVEDFEESSIETLKKLSLGKLYGELTINRIFPEHKKSSLEMLISYNALHPNVSHIVENLAYNSKEKILSGTFKILKDTEEGKKIVDCILNNGYTPFSKMRSIGEIENGVVKCGQFITFDVILIDQNIKDMDRLYLKLNS